MTSSPRIRLLIILVAFACLASGASRGGHHHKRHYRRSIVPAGSPYGVYPTPGQRRTYTLYGARPYWDQTIQSYVMPRRGTSAPIYYSAYPVEHWRDPHRKPILEDDDDDL